MGIFVLVAGAAVLIQGLIDTNDIGYHAGAAQKSAIRICAGFAIAVAGIIMMNYNV